MRNNGSGCYDQACVSIYSSHLIHGGLWSILLAQRRLKQNATTREVFASPGATAISLETQVPIPFNQTQDSQSYVRHSGVCEHKRHTWQVSSKVTEGSLVVYFTVTLA